MSKTILEISQITQLLAPRSLAASWDQEGWELFFPDAPCQGILLSLDLDRLAFQHAMANKINLIITHHPSIFSPISDLQGGEASGRLRIDCLQAGISQISLHTSWDRAPGGVSDSLAQALNQAFQAKKLRTSIRPQAKVQALIASLEDPLVQKELSLPFLMTPKLLATLPEDLPYLRLIDLEAPLSPDELGASLGIMTREILQGPTSRTILQGALRENYAGQALLGRCTQARILNRALKASFLVFPGAAPAGMVPLLDCLQILLAPEGRQIVGVLTGELKHNLIVDLELRDVLPLPLGHRLTEAYSLTILGQKLEHMIKEDGKDDMTSLPPIYLSTDEGCARLGCYEPHQS